jgi:hypothetical protein
MVPNPQTNTQILGVGAAKPQISPVF